MRTRSVISDKFRQSHDARTRRERELSETFAPVTKSIAKMVGRKKTLKKTRRGIAHNILEPRNDDGGGGGDGVGNANATIPDEIIIEPELNVPIGIDEYEDEEEEEQEEEGNEDEDVEMLDVPLGAMKRIRRFVDGDDDDASVLVAKRHAKKRAIAPKKATAPKKAIAPDKNVRKLSNAANIEKAENVHTGAERKRIMQWYKENMERTKRVLQKKKDRQRARERMYQRNSDEPCTEPKKRCPKVIISPEDFEPNTGVYRGSTANKRRKIVVKSNLIQRSKVVVKRRKRKAVGKSLESSFVPYNENIVYEYYDDPNELCDRLQLLVSSQSAGNSNHNQEINSILEELRERNIIM